jgi:hypothetical protein
MAQLFVNVISMLAFKEATAYVSRFVVHLKACVHSCPPYKEDI